jgi:hypothetical protein
VIRIIVRHSRRGNLQRRPFGFSSAACLQSLLISAQSWSEPVECTIVVEDDDHGGELTTSGLPPRCEVVVSSVFGNAESYLFALRLATALPGNDIAYLLEDDYVHIGDIAGLLREGLDLNPGGYVTLYDDPLYYFPSADVDPIEPSAGLRPGLTRHWVATPSTTMSFACHPWVLRRDLEVHLAHLPLGGKPQDRAMWDGLRNRAVLLRCIPGAASHVETTAAGVFVSTTLARMSPDPPKLASSVRAASVPSVAVGSGVSAPVAAAASSWGDCEIVSIADAALLDFDAAVVTRAEKEILDLRLRARASCIAHVFVEGGLQGIRAYGGRDHSADDFSGVPWP